jgi:hypothetical protein
MAQACSAPTRNTGANATALDLVGLAGLDQRPHPQVKIPARGGKLPGTYQGRRGPCPLRGAVNGPRAVLRYPSSSVRGGRRP